MNIELLKKLYYDPKLKVYEIAAILGCSRNTLRRKCKALGLPVRYAKPWVPPDLCPPEFGYFLGAWLADGSAALKVGQILFFNTSYDMIVVVKCCIETLGTLKDVKIIIAPSKGRKGGKPLYSISIYNITFTRWLVKQFEYKDKISSYIFDAPLRAKIAFLSGIVDGDGQVSKDGEIRIRNTSTFILFLPQLCKSISIQATIPKISRILSSGKNYWRITIRRKDFLDQGGLCVVSHKLDRLLNPTPRKRPNQNRSIYECPVCHKFNKVKKAKMCRSCYHKSDECKKHLQTIAKKGNRAANMARWGTAHLKT